MAALRPTGQRSTVLDAAKKKASASTSSHGRAAAPSAKAATGAQPHVDRERLRQRRSTDATPSVPEVRATPTLWDRLRYGLDVEAAGSWPYERRFRRAAMIFVERRKGSRWKYGSIAVCAALWTAVWLIYRR